jgi:hypothetical protein
MTGDRATLWAVLRIPARLSVELSRHDRSLSLQNHTTARIEMSLRQRKVRLLLRIATDADCEAGAKDTRFVRFGGSTLTYAAELAFLRRFALPRMPSGFPVGVLVTDLRSCCL